MTSSQVCLTRSRFPRFVWEPAGPQWCHCCWGGSLPCSPSRTGLQQLRAQVPQEGGTGSHHAHVQPLSTHTHGAGHTHSRDGDSAVAPVCHHHAIISLTCPGSATTAQGGSTVSVEMPGMLWQKVFSESCTFEKALKKPRPLCLNSNWRQTHKLSILFISYCLI